MAAAIASESAIRRPGNPSAPPAPDGSHSPVTDPEFGVGDHRPDRTSFLDA
jgi:hypothetical protein